MIGLVVGGDATIVERREALRLGLGVRDHPP